MEIVGWLINYRLLKENAYLGITVVEFKTKLC
jgi:hypothetical protein